jgi:hypothetical protein
MHGNRRETPINVHALLISVSDPVAPCSYFLDILRQSVIITRTRREEDYTIVYNTYQKGTK